mgnify:CR=1 FL=1
MGTNVGEIAIWDVGTKERLAHKVFKVWEIGSCSLPMQVHLQFHVVHNQHCILVGKLLYVLFLYLKKFVVCGRLHFSKILLFLLIDVYGVLMVHCLVRNLDTS